MSSCASQSNGWIVLRDQSNTIQEEALTTNTVIETEIISTTSSSKTNWGDICNGNDDDEEDNLDDLLDLINSREKLQSLPLPTPPPPPQNTQPSIPSHTSEDTLSSSLSSSFGPIWLSDEYESTLFHSMKSSSNLSHEEELLQKYLKELVTEDNIEEDQRVLNLLKCQQNVSYIYLFFL